MDGRTLPGVLADFDHAARVTGGQATTKADTDGCLAPGADHGYPHSPKQSDPLPPWPRFFVYGLG